MSHRVDPEAELELQRSRSERRQLGQFFTPEPLARYLAELVMRRRPRTLLDPAVGGGRLLRALPGKTKRFGIDVDAAAIDLARRSLPHSVELACGDFLDQNAWPLSKTTFDAIIANPPYIRQQRLTADQKDRRLALNRELDDRHHVARRLLHLLLLREHAPAQSRRSARVRHTGAVPGRQLRHRPQEAPDA